MKHLRAILYEAFNFRNLLQLSPGTQFDEITTHLKNHYMASWEAMKHEDLASMHDMRSVLSKNNYSSLLYKHHKETANKLKDEAKGHIALAHQMAMGLPHKVWESLDKEAKDSATREYRITKTPDSYRYYEPRRRPIPSE